MICGPAVAGPRDDSLIGSFREFCLPNKPDYARLEQKAAEKGLQLLQVREPPGQSDLFFKQKMWMVVLEGGQHAVVDLETNGRDGHLVGCGIAGPEMRTDGFKAVLIAALQLGKPTSDKPLPGGAGQVTRWEGVGGPGTALQLTQGTNAAELQYQVRGPRLP